MRVFVQKLHGEFHNVNAYTAWRGFEERGWEHTFFEFRELENVGLDPEVPVVGGSGTVRKALELLKCKVPLLDSVPAELASHAGRSIGLSTLGAVRANVLDGGAPLFIKPLPEAGKLFNGHVVREFRDLLLTSAHPDALRVVCSNVVDFVAEYRAFLHRGDLVACRHYKGDFRIVPSFDAIDRAVRDWTAAPVACAMDFGVTKDGRTLLVEVNDGYSLGCYGLEPVLYSRLLEDRWREMVGLSLAR